MRRKPTSKPKAPPVAKSTSADELLQYVVENGADMERRMIYLFHEIDEKTARKIVATIHHMDGTDGEITIVMHTMGGAIDDGLAIYDAVRFARNEVMIIGTGSILSMGSVILQAGDRRMLTENAQVMIHQPGIDPGHGTLHDVRVTTAQMERWHAQLRDILAGRVKMTRDELEKAMRDETWYTAEEAVRRGFADDIVRSTKKEKRHVG